MCHWEFLSLGDEMEVADDGAKPSQNQDNNGNNTRLIAEFC